MRDAGWDGPTTLPDANSRTLYPPWQVILRTPTTNVSRGPSKALQEGSSKLRAASGGHILLMSCVLSLFLQLISIVKQCITDLSLWKAWFLLAHIFRNARVIFKLHNTLRLELPG